MQSQELAYKRNLDETLARLEALWTGRMPNGICAAMWGMPNPHKEIWCQKWQPPSTGTERDLPSKEEIFERLDADMQGRAEVEHDSLPVAYGCLDWGESGFAAFLGAKVHFYSRGGGDGAYSGGTYSWAEPLLDDWEKLDSLEFRETNPYYERFVDTLEYLVGRSQGLFGINAFLLIDVLELAMELRGSTHALLDVYDHREELSRLMALGAEMNARILEREYEIIPAFRGGRFTWIGGWVPHLAPVPLSVDPYVYCDAWVYRDLGIEYQEALLERFGSGFMHLHGYRLDLLEMICRMPGMLFVQGIEAGGGIGKGAFQHLDEIKRVAGDMPLLISCEYREFLQAMDARRLPGGVLYSVHGVPSVYAANKTMETVRQYQAPTRWG